MLSNAIDDYIALRRAAGFKFGTQADVLRSFQRHALARGDTHVRAETAVDWAANTSSVHQRAHRLDIVRAFATSARAEDADHEVPPRDVFGRPRYRRPRPYIFSDEEVRSLLNAARELGPRGSLRPSTYHTLVGLIAATGLRTSEALKLTLDDITDDGLCIRETKYRKSRLIPIHATTRDALQVYLKRRRLFFPDDGPLLVSVDGTAIGRNMATTVFRSLARRLGLGSVRGGKAPRLTDLRHTWAVRALEKCLERDKVPLHTRAMSTYLGHVKLASNYWYLTATPHLMTTIADACETYEQHPVGGAR